MDIGSLPLLDRFLVCVVACVWVHMVALVVIPLGVGATEEQEREDGPRGHQDGRGGAWWQSVSWAEANTEGGGDRVEERNTSSCWPLVACSWRSGSPGSQCHHGTCYEANNLGQPGGLRFMLLRLHSV